jgi:hypothetical protein
MKPDLIKLDIGKPYPRPIVYQDGSVFELTNDGAELHLFFGGLTDREIRNFREDPCYIGLTMSESLIVITAAFGEGMSVEGIYHAGLYPENAAPKELQPGSNPNLRYTIPMFLVDHQTEILKAARVITVCPEYTRLLDQAIRHHRRNPITREEYEAQVKRHYERFTSTAQVIEQALIFQRAGI